MEDYLHTSSLIAHVNWTMLPHMNEIWEKSYPLVEKSKKKDKEKQSYFFVDLADPQKRRDDELKKAMELLQKFQSHYQVVLGLNIGEMERMAKSMTLIFPKILKLKHGSLLSIN